MTTNFDFISDDVLRGMIERDKNDMDECLRHKLSKSVLILSGSIIEAILVDYFLAFPIADKTNEQILRASLADLVDWAFLENLISVKSKDLSTVIRGYRNLIHPGKMYRLQENADIYSANVAANLVEIIVQEISKNYAEHLGYTTEQAINKVSIDPSCSSIFPHMVNKMSPVERNKLYRTIPVHAMETETLDTAIESFINLHELISANIPEQVVRTEVEKVYDYIQNRTKMDALFYLRFFYNHLDLLEADQFDAVLIYALNSLISSEEDLNTLGRWNIGRIGKYLNSRNGQEILKKFILDALYNLPKESDIKFLEILEYIIPVYLDYEFRESLIANLKKSDWNKRSQAWAQAIDDFIPF
jgi:hypothetical protein